MQATSGASFVCWTPDAIVILEVFAKNDAGDPDQCHRDV
jgi:hypothetical protein